MQTKIHEHRRGDGVGALAPTARGTRRPVTARGTWRPVTCTQRCLRRDALRRSDWSCRSWLTNRSCSRSPKTQAPRAERSLIWSREWSRPAQASSSPTSEVVASTFRVVAFSFGNALIYFRPHLLWGWSHLLWGWSHLLSGVVSFTVRIRKRPQTPYIV